MTILQAIKAGAIPVHLTVDQVHDLTAADGEIVPVAAAKADWHEVMTSRLTRGLVRALPDRGQLARLRPAGEGVALCRAWRSGLSGR